MLHRTANNRKVSLGLTCGRTSVIGMYRYGSTIFHVFHRVIHWVLIELNILLSTIHATDWLFPSCKRTYTNELGTPNAMGSALPYESTARPEPPSLNALEMHS